MTTRQQQQQAAALDQRSYAVKVFGAQYGVKLERSGKWPVWTYFRTELGATTYNNGELKGKGKVLPL